MFFYIFCIPNAFALFSKQAATQHRGVMIDTGRHYLSYQSIKRTIDGMSMQNLNVLHWRFSQQQAFNAIIPGIQEIGKQGAFQQKQVYTSQGIKQVIEYAKNKGISIVPQFITPCHTGSWGYSQQYKDMVIPCGCLDVSNQTAWNVSKIVMKFVYQNFQGKYVHLGSKADYTCWDKQPRIKQYMKQKSIATYDQLNEKWFEQLKNQLPGKKYIFWDYCIKDQDINQYTYNQYSKLNNSSCKVILSPSSSTWLNLGLQPDTTRLTWKNMRSNFVLYPAQIDKDRILGGQLLVWGNYVNDDILDNVLWPRSVVISDILFQGKSKFNLQTARMLYQAQNKLRAIGIYSQPFASQFCQMNPQTCF